MGEASDTRSCTHTRYWESYQDGTTGGSTKYNQPVTTSQNWKYIKAWDTWVKDGGLNVPDNVSNFRETSAPPYPYLGGTRDGEITTTTGSGIGDIVTAGTPVYKWGESAVRSSTHSHPTPSITSGGRTLYYQSCTASAGTPSTTPTSSGQTTDTKGNGTATYYTSWDDPPPSDTTPPVVTASASFTGTQMSITFSATDSNGISLYKVYISNKEQTFYGLKNTYTSSGTYTFPTDGTNQFFASGYFYNVKVEALDPSSNIGEWVKTNIKYNIDPPSAPSAPTVTNITHKSATISWNQVTGATAYSVELVTSSENFPALGSGHIVTATSYTPDALIGNTDYKVRIVSLVSDGNGGYIKSASASPTTTFKTPVDPNAVKPNVTITGTNGENRISFSWEADNPSNVANYNVKIGSGAEVNVTGTSYTFTSNNGTPFVNGQSYTVYVRAWGNGGIWSDYASANVTYTYVDTFPPVVTIGTPTVIGSELTINWTATDDTGFRTTNTYEIFISGKNGTIGSPVYRKGWVNFGTNTYTFTNDGQGLPFVNNQTYLVRVIAYDNKTPTANAGSNDRIITFKLTKPSPVSWTMRNRNMNFDVTAEQWNDIQEKIRQAQSYKGVGISTLNKVNPNDVFTHTIWNNVRSAILSLSPTHPVPPAKNKNDSVLADDLNNLALSLNSAISQLPN